MARVTKQPDERKQEITVAARKLFCEKGFDETTITEISSYLGIAQGLVYHYFRSKMDILYAVVEELAADHVMNVEKVILDSEGTAIECLRLLLNNTYTCGREEDVLIQSLAENQGALEYIRIKMITSIAPLLTVLIERGNEDMSWLCEHPKESADFILHGFSAYSMFSDNKPPKEEIREAFEDIIIRILGVKS